MKGPDDRMLHACRALAKTPFARPTFTTKQNDRIGRRQRPGKIEGLPDFWVGAVELNLGDLGTHPLGEVVHPIAQPAQPPDPFKNGPDLCGCKRLGQVVERTASSSPRPPCRCLRTL